MTEQPAATPSTRRRQRIPVSVWVPALAPVVVALLSIWYIGQFVVDQRRDDALWPFTESRPSLVGVTPAAASGDPERVTLTVRDPTGRWTKVPVARYRLPDSWAVTSGTIDRDKIGEITVNAWRAGPGVNVADDDGRRRVGRLQSQLAEYGTGRYRVGPPVSRQVAGRPAVEVAASNKPLKWEALHTYVFVDRTVVEVTCTTSYNSSMNELVRPCAAVLASLEVTA